MKLADIKKKMLEYEDFYGSDFIATDKIKKAKTKKELNDIIELHRRLLEDTLLDAMTHLDDFKKEVGLN